MSASAHAVRISAKISFLVVNRTGTLYSIPKKRFHDVSKQRSASVLRKMGQEQNAREMGLVTMEHAMLTSVS